MIIDDTAEYSVSDFFLDIWPWLASGLFLGCVLAYCVYHTWTQYLKMDAYYSASVVKDSASVYVGIVCAMLISVGAGFGCNVRLAVMFYEGAIPLLVERWIPLVGYLSFFWVITSILMMFWAYTVGRKTVDKQVLKTRMVEEFDKELGL